MKKLLPAVFLSALLAALPSCVLAAGAVLGAGAMYSLGEDSVQTYFDAPMTDVFAAAQAEFRDRGSMELLEAGNDESFIRARVENVEVEVFLKRITDNTTEMVIKARKWEDMAPDLESAERVADRISYRITK
ncbi:MAG: DUF3568 family protein [Planctomycetota bacterium]|nr:DUF3568 family protein [Planctomycetota bacterium]MDA1113547.1 DUF3568 family protein [Planctomycetota bacterium]